MKGAKSETAVTVEIDDASKPAVYAKNTSLNASRFFGITRIVTEKGSQAIKVGVFGEGYDKELGAGVLGIGRACGVLGVSPIGKGIEGYCENGIGVQGTSTHNHGVIGTSTKGGRVRGDTRADDPACAGVRGTSDWGKGIHGYSESGQGVYGFITKDVGVRGDTKSTNDESAALQKLLTLL